MAFLFRCDSLGKSYGSRQLFRDISISFEDGERTGLIGPNGSGKSTLLKILAGLERPDDGTLTIRRNIRLGYVPQSDVFTAGATVRDVLRSSGTPDGVDEHDMDVKAAILMDKIGFNDPDQEADSLSGGWRKRLAIARQLIRDPDVVLFDEPTNHLDLEGIEWLERVLATAPFAFLPVQPRPLFSPGDHQSDRRIEHRVRQWVSQRAVALHGVSGQEGRVFGCPGKPGDVGGREGAPGTGMAVARGAGPVDQGQGTHSAGRGTGRRTEGSENPQHQAGRGGRRLRRQRTPDPPAAGGGKSVEENGVNGCCSRTSVSPSGRGDKLGLVGPNGSGKTTLIKMMTNQLQPDGGQFRRADGLRVVVFDQARVALDQNQTLKAALSPGGESLQFRGQTIHVSSWAQRFLFRSQQLDMAVRDLSGGEQARIPDRPPDAPTGRRADPRRTDE